MKRLFGVLFAVAFSTAAIAADMPLKAAPYQAQAAWNWSGFYASVEGGWNLGKFNPVFGGGELDSTAVNLDDNSAFVGGSLRFLHQTGMFVFGAEGGIQWWGFKSQAELVQAIPASEESPAVTAVLLQSKIDWLAYVGGRLGISPFANNSTLLYVGGGAAFGHLKGTLVNVGDLNAAVTQSITGWYIGGGLDFRITDNIIFGGEYRHIDFGDVNALGAIGVLIGAGNARLTTDQAMGRITFKLN